MSKPFTIDLDTPEPECTLIVRCQISAYKDKRGVHFKKSLLFQKRKSKGHCFLSEDVDMVGASETIARITNLEDAKHEQLYQVVICNEHRDFETGHIEDYDFKLIPLL